jgi:hypothetical protein
MALRRLWRLGTWQNLGAEFEQTAWIGPGQGPDSDSPGSSRPGATPGFGHPHETQRPGRDAIRFCTFLQTTYGFPKPLGTANLVPGRRRQVVDEVYSGVEKPGSRPLKRGSAHFVRAPMSAASSVGCRRCTRPPGLIDRGTESRLQRSPPAHGHGPWAPPRRDPGGGPTPRYPESREGRDPSTLRRCTAGSDQSMNKVSAARRPHRQGPILPGKAQRLPTRQAAGLGHFGATSPGVGDWAGGRLTLFAF